MANSTKIKLPSPTERMELILLGMARRQPVKTLCRQAGVSRELFYRWMKKVRKAALAALEAEAPGPKPNRESPRLLSRIPKTQDRTHRLEQELAQTRKEKDRLKILFQVAQRIIQRRAWGPIPGAEVKKNGMPLRKRAISTARSGPRKKPWQPRPLTLPPAGPFTAPPTGDGFGADINQEGPKS